MYTHFTSVSTCLPIFLPTSLHPWLPTLQPWLPTLPCTCTCLTACLAWPFLIHDRHYSQALYSSVLQTPQYINHTAHYSVLQTLYQEQGFILFSITDTLDITARLYTLQYYSQALYSSVLARLYTLQYYSQALYSSVLARLYTLQYYRHSRHYSQALYSSVLQTL